MDGPLAGDAFPPGTVSHAEFAGLPPPPFALENAPQPQADAPPAKRRRLKGLDRDGLVKLLGGFHGCLERMARASGEDGESGEVPVDDLVEEFERHWRLRFDPLSMGEPSAAAFLRRFPGVFQMRTCGVHVVVSPCPSPDFTKAAEVGLERPSERDRNWTDFVAGSGEMVAAVLANLVAEERKASGAPLPFQFAQFEVVQDLISRLKDGGLRDVNGSLMNSLLDPKPIEKKPDPPPQKNDDDDRRDYRRDDRRDDYRDRDDFRDDRRPKGYGKGGKGGKRGGKDGGYGRRW